MNQTTFTKYPFSVHPNVVLIILMISLLLILASLGFIVWWVYKVKSCIKGFNQWLSFCWGMTYNTQNLMRILLNKILSLLHAPRTTVTQNITQPQPTTSTQPEPVTRVPAALVTTKSPLHSESMPPLPPTRGLMPPTKGLILARSTEQLTEALREVMIELDTPEPSLKKYKKYLQKQSTETCEIGQTKM